MAQTILVIEDDKAFQNLLARTIKGAGFDVIVARDGIEGRERAMQERPALILLDILLPKLDGRTVLRDLKRDERTSEIPVIAMSGVFRGRQSARDIQEAGAAGFLEKPFSTRDLVATLQSVLGTGGDTEMAAAPVEKVSLVERGVDEVLWGAMRDRFSGAVQFKHEKTHKIVLLQKGMPKLVRSNATGECLGRRFLARERIDQAALKESLRMAKAHGLQQGAALVRLGAVTPEEVEAELRAQGEDKLLDLFTWEDGEAWLQPGVQQMAFSTPLVGWTPRMVLFRGVQRMKGASILARLSPYSGGTVTIDPATLSPDEHNIPEIAGLLAAVRQDPSVDPLLEPHGKALYALWRTGDLQFSSPPKAAAASGGESVDSERMIRLKQQRSLVKSQTHYERLGLAEDSKIDEVRKAFLAAAKEYHPDRHRDEPEEVRAIMAEIFSLLSDANETLSDPELRRVYTKRIKSGRSEEEDRETVKRILTAEQKFKEAEGLMRRREYSQALALFREAMELQPDEAEFLAHYGWTYYLVHQGDEQATIVAREHLDKALSMTPEGVAVLYFRAQLHKACGEDELAKRMFGKVLERRPKHVEAARELRLMEMRKTKGDKGGIFGLGRKKK